MSFLKSIYLEYFAKNDKISKRIYTKTDYDRTYDDVRKIFKMTGIRISKVDSPIVRFCYDIYYWIQFLGLSSALFCEVSYCLIAANGPSFEGAFAIFSTLPCISYVILSMLKGYKMVLYRPIYESLIDELRELWPVGTVSDAEHSVLSRALKEINFVVKGYIASNYTLAFSYFLVAFFNVLKRAFGYETPRLLAFHYWWFGVDFESPEIYEYALITQFWQRVSKCTGRRCVATAVRRDFGTFDWWRRGRIITVTNQRAKISPHGRRNAPCDTLRIAIITVWFMMCGDLLFYIFLSHITTQLDLLGLRIVNLVQVPVDNQLIKSYPLAIQSDSSEKKREDATTNEKQQHHKLKSIAKRHADLIRLTTYVEDIFGFALLINFIITSLIICFCGFCAVIVERWNEMTYKLFLLTSLAQTGLMCWFGQKLVDSSTRIGDAVYTSGWYTTSKKIKSMLLIILHRSQKEIHVTTYGFSTICLASYATIIKSSWSYFTILLNTYKKK